MPRSGLVQCPLCYSMVPSPITRSTSLPFLFAAGHGKPHTLSRGSDLQHAVYLFDFSIVVPAWMCQRGSQGEAHGKIYSRAGR